MVLDWIIPLFFLSFFLVCVVGGLYTIFRQYSAVKEPRSFPWFLFLYKFLNPS